MKIGGMSTHSRRFVTTAPSTGDSTAEGADEKEEDLAALFESAKLDIKFFLRGHLIPSWMPVRDVLSCVMPDLTILRV